MSILQVFLLSTDKKLEDRAEQIVHTWFHRYRRGSLRFFILHLLLYQHSDNKSFHGYKLAKAIHRETHGDWSPKTASIYPILKELVKDGVIEHIPDSETSSDDSSRNPKQYCLTPFGIIVARKIEDHRKNMTQRFISRTGEAPHPPPPMFRLPKAELLEILEQSDVTHLKEFKRHLLTIQNHNQKLLDMIDKLLKEKEKN